MAKHVDLPPATEGTAEEMAFREGFFVGLLVGEGHFGGDGKQPQVTLRMHVRHEQLFDWIDTYFPGGKRFGPYSHGGRHYYQWMARGPFLRERVLPVLARRLTPDVDAPASQRYHAMLLAYGLTAASATDRPAAKIETPSPPPAAGALGAEPLDSDHV